MMTTKLLILMEKRYSYLSINLNLVIQINLDMIRPRNKIKGLLLSILNFLKRLPNKLIGNQKNHLNLSSHKQENFLL